MKKIFGILIVFVLFVQFFSFAGAQTVTVGDADGDGSVTAADARIALRLAVSLDRASYRTKIYADADADGAVTAEDARTLLRFSVNLDDESVLAQVSLKNPVFSRYPDAYHLTEMKIKQGTELFINDIVSRSDESAVWTSSNPDCVTVTENGKINAVAKGFACVICTIGEEKFYYAVTVFTEVQERLDALRSKYPDGYYWNAYEPSEKYPAVTETPCRDHSSGGYSMCIGQCWGFANLISDEVFGEDAPVIYDITAETMKIGDHIRTSHHSVIITDLIRVGDVIGYDYYNDKNITAPWESVIVVHCNWDGKCSIMWDYDYVNYIYYYDFVDSYYSYTRY